MDNRIEKVKEILDVEGIDGNWNRDSYHLGLFNGLEVAYSILVGKDPDYRVKPKDGFLVDEGKE